MVFLTGPFDNLLTGPGIFYFLRNHAFTLAEVFPEGPGKLTGFGLIGLLVWPVALRTQDIFRRGFRVKDLLLVPQENDHWFDSRPLWQG